MTCKDDLVQKQMFHLLDVVGLNFLYSGLAGHWKFELVNVVDY